MDYSFLFTIWFSVVSPSAGYEFNMACNDSGCTARSSVIPSCTGLKITGYSPQFFFVEPYVECTPYQNGYMVNVKFRKLSEDKENSNEQQR